MPADNVVVTALKRSEDRRTVIVRLLNLDRVATSTEIRCLYPVQKAYRTNLNEERQGELNVESDKKKNQYSFDFRRESGLHN